MAVLSKGGGTKIAVEVTLSYKNAFDNIQKDLRDYDKVIIVYEHPYTKSIVKGWVEARLPEEKRKLVKFEHIKEYAAYVGV